MRVAMRRVVAWCRTRMGLSVDEAQAARARTKAFQKDGGGRVTLQWADSMMARKRCRPLLRGSNQDRTHVGFGDEQVLRQS
ncbi:hypothetical protein DF142_34700 [Burkholderia cenocepacia]|nr:hypothetical protein DF142_34700 [Burkholderia cenocepacia]RQU55528.1 hypothetical protein DF140_34320 [Burkholderia cenocepacia]